MNETDRCDPKDYRYLNSRWLVKQLDYYVKDTEDGNYLLLKQLLMKAAEKADNQNPFEAGRPQRFSDEEKIEIYYLKHKGRWTYKQIAKQYDCSVSLAYRAANDGMYLARKK